MGLFWLNEKPPHPWTGGGDNCVIGWLVRLSWVRESLHVAYLDKIFCYLYGVEGCPLA